MPFLARTGGSIAILLAAAALTLSAQANIDSIPMEVVHGKPYVMVYVNGRGPFRFLIDTGTGGQALISNELAERLELPKLGFARLNDPSGQGGKKAPIVLIDSLYVGRVGFTTVKAIQHMLSSQEGTCEGVLGFTLFRDYLLTLDYPNRRMLLGSGALEPNESDGVLPFRMPEGVPIAPLLIGDLRIEAQIDSGGTGLSLPERVSRKLKFVSDPAVLGTGHSLSTRFEVKAGRLAANIQLGNYTFDKPFIEINPAFPLANFGSCPLQNFAVTLDQKSKLMRLEARQKVLHLAIIPTALRLKNESSQKPLAPDLVPVG